LSGFILCIRFFDRLLVCLFFVRTQTLCALVFCQDFIDAAAHFYAVGDGVVQNELELRNKAKTYKLVKYISLAVCIIASPMLFFLPIALWYVVFCVKNVHSKIPFLVKGEEAVVSVKKIDEQSIKG
jgi:hypothetical protein